MRKITELTDSDGITIRTLDEAIKICELTSKQGWFTSTGIAHRAWGTYGDKAYFNVLHDRVRYGDVEGTGVSMNLIPASSFLPVTGLKGLDIDWGNIEALTIDIVQDGIQAEDSPVAITGRILELLEPVRNASQPLPEKGVECSECAFPIVCSNPYCEKSLTPTTPTTDWDKVRKILDNRTHHNDDTEKTIQALKQHIGAGDSNTAYNDRIDSLVPNGWQQKLHDYIVNELSAIPLNNQLTDIRDIILPKRYPYTLTAPASEQVDWETIDNLPEKHGAYLVKGITKNKAVIRWICQFNGSKFHGFKRRKVTHWKPLPK